MAGGDVKKTNGEEDGSRADAHQVSAVPASDDVDGESSAPPPQQQHGAAGAAEGGGDPAEAPAEGAEEEEEEEAPKGPGALAALSAKINDALGPFFARFSPATLAGLIIAFILFMLLVGGGAATDGRPWLVQGASASKAYFAAGDAAVGVISLGSSVGVGFFSIGIVSISVFGSVGVFSVGLFSVGFFSIGVFSLGHVAIGVWAYGVISRWIKAGEGWEDGRCLFPKKAEAIDATADVFHGAELPV